MSRGASSTTRDKDGNLALSWFVAGDSFVVFCCCRMTAVGRLSSFKDKPAQPVPWALSHTAVTEPGFLDSIRRPDPQDDNEYGIGHDDDDDNDSSSSVRRQRPEDGIDMAPVLGAVDARQIDDMLEDEEWVDHDAAEQDDSTRTEMDEWIGPGELVMQEAMDP